MVVVAVVAASPVVVVPSLCCVGPCHALPVPAEVVVSVNARSILRSIRYYVCTTLGTPRDPVVPGKEKGRKKKREKRESRYA